MGFFEASFEIVEEKDCPMYNRGDLFHLSGLAFRAPSNKPSCLFLTKELTEIMLRKLGEQQIAPNRKGRTSFNCSGCTGLIKFEIKKKQSEQYATPHMRLLAASEKSLPPAKERFESVANMLSSFSLFQVLDDQSLSDLVPHLKIKKFNTNELVVEKGEEGTFLYLIVSGKVEVIDNGNTLAFLDRGEIFGEMSLLTGKKVGATIKVNEPSTIVFINHDQFRNIIIKYPSIQMAVTRILAQRLNTANVNRLQDTGSSSFTGQLAEIPPAELFQLLNGNQKTGKVTLTFSNNQGYLIFNNGEVTQVVHNGLSGQSALISILKQTKGNFDFTPGLSEAEKAIPSMGNFMGILMEALQKVDEE